MIFSRIRAVAKSVNSRLREVARAWLLTIPPPGRLRFAAQYSETLPLLRTRRKGDGPLVLNWLIPDFQIGAGGHTTIIRIVHWLERFGHKSHLWIVGGTQWQTAEKARQIIRQHFFPIEASVHLVKDSRELSNIEGDGVIATSYPTAYPARHVQNVAQRFYLVQDFEPSFFPMGSEYLLAEETYRFGFTCITAGVWLQRLLRDNYGVEAYNFPLACDHDIYFPDAAQRRSPNRVAVYARHTTPRRAVEIAVLALEIASRNRSDLVADLFGMSVRTAYGKFNYVDHGVLAPKQLAKLYRSACVGMALSCTNYSLVPMEMMACGCPVMDLRLPSVQAVFSDDLVALADPDPKSIADRLIQLMASENDRERQSCRALTYARSLSWEESARNVEQAFMSSVRDSSNASPGAL